MKPFDQLLTGIASEHFGISTLKTRNSDSLDFHDVAVWKVEAALKAALYAFTGSKPTLVPARSRTQASDCVGFCHNVPSTCSP